MAGIGEIVCDFNNPLTGSGACAYSYSPDTYLLGLPPGKPTLDAAFFDGLPGTLVSLLTAENPINRGVLIGRFNDPTPNPTEEQTVQTADGALFYTRDAVWQLQYLIAQASTCLQKAYGFIDGSHKVYKFIKIQKKKFGVGIKATNVTTLAREVTGYTFQSSYLKALTPAGYSTTSDLVMAFNQLDPKADAKNESYIDFTNIDLDGIANNAAVQEVSLESTELVPATALIFKFKAFAGCSGQNLGLIYGTAFAAVGNFTANRTDTGAPLTISTVAVNTTTGEITLTIAGPLAAGIKVSIKTNLIATLFTAIGIYVQTRTTLVLVNHA